MKFAVTIRTNINAVSATLFLHADLTAACSTIELSRNHIIKKLITADELYLNIFANLPKVKIRIKISCVDFPSISGYIDAEN